jgi:transcriptional regulator with XRE-family HTH domain
MSADWPTQIREARLALGLTQAALAKLANVSENTVRKYESGLRKPTLETLNAVLRALRLNRWDANQIRHSLGFAADYLRMGQLEPTFMFSLEELPNWMEGNPWPQFVVDENLQIVVANSAAQRVWRVDLEREFPTLHDRSMTKFAADPRFAGCVVNWEEMVSHAVAIWKGHHLGAETLDRPSTYFDVALAELAKGDPQFVSRFVDLWQKTAGKTPKVRDRYRVVWQVPGCSPITFIGLTSSANEWEGLAFNDWIPVDAASWLALEQVIAA